MHLVSILKTLSLSDLTSSFLANIFSRGQNLTGPVRKNAKNEQKTILVKSTCRLDYHGRACEGEEGGAWYYSAHCAGIVGQLGGLFSCPA